MANDNTKAWMNHYEILDLDPHQDQLSPASVKTAYKRALLRHHPDKGGHRQTPSAQKDAPSSVTVDQIALAYTILSDPALRAEYDRALHAGELVDSRTGSNVFHTGLDTVDLDDLKFDEQSNTWTRDCRCGHAQGFVVTEAELTKNAEDAELIVGCRGCSLWLRVLFSVEE